MGGSDDQDDPRRWWGITALKQESRRIGEEDRLGWGADFEEPDRRRSRADARARFLDAVRQHAPEVLNDLVSGPFQCYQQLSELLARPAEGTPRRWTITELRTAARGNDPSLGILLDSLQGWGEHWFYLPPDWILNAALSTMHHWTRWGLPPVGSAARLRWFIQGDALGAYPISQEEQRFVFEHLGWHMAYQPEAVAVEMLREAFEKELATYVRRLKRRAQELGLRRTPQKRTEDHWHWLVLYQVRGIVSWTQIKRHLHASGAPVAEPKTISDGVKKAADQVGLRLRETAKPGKPAKQRSP